MSKMLSRSELVGFRTPTSVKAVNKSKGMKILFGKFLRAGQSAIVIRRGSDWASMYDLEDYEITLVDRGEIVNRPETREANTKFSSGTEFKKKPDIKLQEKKEEAKPQKEQKEITPQEKKKEEVSVEKTVEKKVEITEVKEAKSVDKFPEKGTPEWDALSPQEKGKITKQRKEEDKSAPSTIKRK